ncbi:MAG: VWA domain-containing protein [Verrucomicrobia bacterium]|nr:VWA domain-containing protein [Verrucomicrobiota bacterium]
MNHKLQLAVVLAGVAALAAGAAPSFGAQQIKVSAALGRPVLLADAKQTTYLKVSLTGFSTSQMEKRTPVNVAIVLDRSGSMSGEKLRKAKEAAILAIDRLNSDDIVSVVAYDDQVQVLVPATKVSDRAGIHAAIARLQSGGSTALFAGVSKGAAEVRKFLDRQRTNRVILLSDGIANVGPSSPSDLGELGSSLIKEGIAVTTIGLGDGFNEDLMTKLASKSDGNHWFVEHVQDLARIYNTEFGDVLSVVAQEVVVRVRCADGVRPVRILGREGDITGQIVTVGLNQLYADKEKFVLIEVEVPSTGAGRQREIAATEVTYANMATHRADRIRCTASARFTNSSREVDANENRYVMISAVEMIAVENNQRATALRDAGKIEEARGVLLLNSGYLGANATKYNAPDLQQYGDANRLQSQSLSNETWNMMRKEMRYDQRSRSYQQAAPY